MLPLKRTLLTAVLAVASILAYSQTLPSQSRPVYKCYSEEGKVTYSDSPCLEAQQLKLESNRGVDKVPPKERARTSKKGPGD